MKNKIKKTITYLIGISFIFTGLLYFNCIISDIIIKNMGWNFFNTINCFIINIIVILCIYFYVKYRKNRITPFMAKKIRNDMINENEKIKKQKQEYKKKYNKYFKNKNLIK